AAGWHQPVPVTRIVPPTPSDSTVARAVVPEPVGTQVTASPGPSVPACGTPPTTSSPEVPVRWTSAGSNRPLSTVADRYWPATRPRGASSVVVKVPSVPAVTSAQMVSSPDADGWSTMSAPVRVYCDVAL